MNPLSSVLAQARESFAGFWEARDARERRFLAAAATVVLLALAYLLLIDPALTGRTRLNQELPRMRQDAAQLQALSRQFAGLSGQTAAPAPLSREGVEAALARNGLKAQSLAVTGDNVRLQMPAVSFAGLVAWLNEMQRTAALSPIEANIVAQPQADTVDATLTLRQVKPD